MTISSLPTDATYKLILILGLVLLITSGYEIKNTGTYYITSGYKADSLTRALKIIKEARDSRINYIKNSNGYGSPNQRRDSIEATNDVYFIKQDVLINTTEAYQAQKDIAYSNLIFYTVIIILGCFASVYGYLKWSKQQSIDDAMKLKQLQILELQYQSKLNPSKPDFTKYRKS